MKGAENRECVRHLDLGSVPELRPRPGDREPSISQDSQRLLISEAAENHDDTNFRQDVQFSLEPRAACVAFRRGRLVRWRRATDTGCHDEVGQNQPVVQ